LLEEVGELTDFTNFGAEEKFSTDTDRPTASETLKEFSCMIHEAIAEALFTLGSEASSQP
jgi:hypothetical protein